MKIVGLAFERTMQMSKKKKKKANPTIKYDGDL